MFHVTLKSHARGPKRLPTNTPNMSDQYALNVKIIMISQRCHIFIQIPSPINHSNSNSHAIISYKHGVHIYMFLFSEACSMFFFQRLKRGCCHHLLFVLHSRMEAGISKWHASLVMQCGIILYHFPTLEFFKDIAN